MRQRRNNKLHPWLLPALLSLPNDKNEEVRELERRGKERKCSLRKGCQAGFIPHCYPNKPFACIPTCFSFMVQSQELGDLRVQNAGRFTQSREGFGHLCGISPLYGPSFRISRPWYLGCLRKPGITFSNFLQITGLRRQGE